MDINYSFYTVLRFSEDITNTCILNEFECNKKLLLQSLPVTARCSVWDNLVLTYHQSFFAVLIPLGDTYEDPALGNLCNMQMSAAITDISFCHSNSVHLNFYPVNLGIDIVNMLILFMFMQIWAKILHNGGPNLHNFAYANHTIILEMGLSKPQTLKT